MNIDFDKERMASELKGSLLEFIKTFFPLLTGKDLIISSPLGRESHHITLARVLTQAARLEIPHHRLLIAMPPGYGKSLFVSMWVAWTMAQYPDSKYLYISYSHELAAKHTAFIKSIIQSRYYKYLFDIEVRQDSRAKDHFSVNTGGSVRAFGSGGAVTGQDAGAPGLDRFSGAVILDDPIKPDDVHSDSVRGNVIRNYEETIRQRVRGVNVPIVFIGQRLHEDDLGAYLAEGKDITEWESLVLKAIDGAGNALYPEMMPLKTLLAMQEKSPYVFASQYQQDPIPSGGGIFKPEWFVFLDFEPKYVTTFITCDTAETDKTYNDATVFGFFGLYEIESFGRKTGTMGLHWIDCVEIRVEPKDLKGAFMDFYAECCYHVAPPQLIAIEKKSTGVTLVSILQELRGVQVRPIDRTKASGSKTQRFLEIQPYVASKLVSFTRDAKHATMCINHMAKITSNNTHRHDDIADVLTDSIKLALIEKTIYSNDRNNTTKEILNTLNSSVKRKILAGAITHGRTGKTLF